MKKQPWLFVIGLLLTAGSQTVRASHSASEPAIASALPRGNAQSPAYPNEWKEFKENMEKVHQAFEAHIKGAKNITVPIARKEFEWEVNWDAQQAYCKGIAKAIFSRPRKAQFAWPDAMAARDGVEKVYDAIEKTFPRCQAPKPTTDEIFLLMNLGLPDPLNRGHLRALQSTWRKEAWLDTINRNALGLAYFTAPNYLLKLSFLKGVPPPLFDNGPVGNIRTAVIPTVMWESNYDEDVATGCPVEGSSTLYSVDPTATPGFSSELPTLFLRISGELIPVEFGIYGYRGPYQETSSDVDANRWGRKGQKFLFIRTMKHALSGDWALSALPKDFEISGLPSSEKGVRRACVINFE